LTKPPSVETRNSTARPQLLRAIGGPFGGLLGARVARYDGDPSDRPGQRLRVALDHHHRVPASRQSSHDRAADSTSATGHHAGQCHPVDGRQTSHQDGVDRSASDEFVDGDSWNHARNAQFLAVPGEFSANCDCAYNTLSGNLGRNTPKRISGAARTAAPLC
jgi:hypothetical protein